jgi:hypothetical protein
MHVRSIARAGTANAALPGNSGRGSHWCLGSVVLMEKPPFLSFLWLPLSSSSQGLDGLPGTRSIRQRRQDAQKPQGATPSVAIDSPGCTQTTRSDATSSCSPSVPSPPNSPKDPTAAASAAHPVPFLRNRITLRATWALSGSSYLRPWTALTCRPQTAVGLCKAKSFS